MTIKRGMVLLLAIVTLALSACSGGAAGITGSAYAAQPATATAAQASTVSTQEAADEGSVASSAGTGVATVTVDYDSDDLEPAVSTASTTFITLERDSISVEGTGAAVDGSIVTITTAGTYSVSGTLDDGQVIVDTEDGETVFLILDGAELNCSTGAPLYVRNADKTVISLADGTENSITDGTSYVFKDAESDGPNAALFSADDLTINGSGSLTVHANFNNGITSKDDLKITGGEITVYAVNDGIRGRDSIAVKDGTITVDAGGDGLQANNDEDAGEGYIIIEGGVLNVSAGLDGIQAESTLLVSDGELAIVTGGGSVETGGGGAWGGRGMEANPIVTADSAKGLKAGVTLTITGGSIQIDALDDALHANDTIVISGGDIVLASGDDGIHADSSLTIDDGELNITRSYEGLESQVITINDGTVYVTASDDGINCSSGGGAAGGGFPMRGQAPGGFETGNGYLYINGGYLFVDAGGDGLDTNVSFEMTGGTVIVNGPTNDGNGPLDYLGTFNISGGFLVAVGSAGMAQAPSTTSTQYSMMYNFTSAQRAGTMVHIETGSGGDVLTFTPTKQYQSVLFSSPELEGGSTYVIYTGGSSSGTASDGLYSGGSYSGGTQVDSLTLTGVVTGSGSAMGGFRGSPRMRP